jgi:hypothetical protein
MAKKKLPSDPTILPKVFSNARELLRRAKKGETIELTEEELFEMAVKYIEWVHEDQFALSRDPFIRKVATNESTFRRWCKDSHMKNADQYVRSVISDRIINGVSTISNFPLKDNVLKTILYSYSHDMRESAEYLSGLKTKENEAAAPKGIPVDFGEWLKKEKETDAEQTGKTTGNSTT